MPGYSQATSEGTRPDKSIPRTSLASAVADKLREMIIRGEMQEGEQLGQDAIAGWLKG